MMSRPNDANADAWHVFLAEHLDNRATHPHGLTYVAVQIAEAIDKALDDAKKSGRTATENRISDESLRAEVERLTRELIAGNALNARLVTERSRLAKDLAERAQTANNYMDRAQSAEAALAELREKVSDLTDTALDQDNSNVHIAFWQEELRALRSLLPTSTDKGGDNGVE